MFSLIGVLWVATTASLVSALLAWRKARATAKRLEQLTQMYWELKYQHGELRVQLQRVASGEPLSPPPPPVTPAGVIPLSSLKSPGTS